MITCFPDPYPDELLYSICARYGDRVRYPTQKRFLVRELFGAKCSSATVGLPCHLAHLLSVLPPGHPYTVKRLIDDHTLLPFYRPFQTPERVEKVQKSMSGSQSTQALHRTLGLTSTKVHPSSWLRFCPICAQEEQNKYGESYWHRLHQLLGVEVCPIHYVFLENSKVRLDNSFRRFEYVSGSQAIESQSYHSIDLSNPCHQVLLRIAIDATWLLNQQYLLPGYDSLKNQYHKLLLQRRLSCNSGIVQSKKLVQEFLSFYPSELLIKTQSSFNEDRPANWLSMLIRNLRQGTATHPLRHLLLIQFLGQTAEEFFKLSGDSAIFGNGPWPCLDPTSEHFQQLTIETCQISRKTKDNKPIGHFYCSCGFSYNRIGPDLSPLDRLRFDYPLSYSQSWETALKNLWEDSSLTLKEIGQQLGVSHSTISYRANRLKLPFPRLGSGTRPAQAKPTIPSLQVKRTFQEKLKDYRQIWLSALEEKPGVTRSLLKKDYLRTYRWLSSNDAEWLEAHKPPSLRVGGKYESVNWESRDIQLAEDVRTAAQNLKNAPGRPVRVTKRSIGFALGRPSFLSTKTEGDKLPLTVQVIAEVVESLDDIQIRRLQWATDCFLQERIYPQQIQLLRRAGFTVPKRVKSPKIIEAIDVALQSLASLNGVFGGSENYQ